MKIELHADRTRIRAAGESTRHVWLSIEASQVPARPGRTPVNLALVLDRSGSMSGAKLEHAKAAVLQALSTLQPEDRVALVIYDDEVTTLMESCLASPRNRARARERLHRVYARGTTALFDGWLTGCEQVAMHLEPAEVGRCLLLTDGLANRGLTRREEILGHVTALRERRVSTTTFGVGADFDEVLLQGMAEAGGGNSYFIESAHQIPDFVASEVGEVLQVVVPGAVLVVTAPPGALVRSLNDYPGRREGDTWRFELGSLVSGQVLDPVLELTWPAGEPGARHELRVHVEDQHRTAAAPPQRLTFAITDDADRDAEPRDHEVARRAAELLAARASRRALECNEAEDYGQARAVLEGMVQRLRELAEGDEALLAIASELEDKVEDYGQSMSRISRKMSSYDAYRRLKQRSAEGRAERQVPAAGVVLLPTSTAVEAIGRRALEALGPVGSEIFGALDIGRALLDDDDIRIQGDVMTAAEEVRLVDRAARERPAGSRDVRIVVTTRGLRDRWFSHWHGPERVAIVSLHAWESTAAVPAAAFVAYELVLHGLAARSPRYVAADLLHEQTRSCLFDLCRLRADIERKLQAADLCEPCRGMLVDRGIEPASVDALGEVVRQLASEPPRLTAV